MTGKLNASSRYWVKCKLPDELLGLTMTQLTALRKLVQRAFTDGKQDERKAKGTA